MKIELNTLLENDIIESGKVTEVICNDEVIWKGLSEDVGDLAERYAFVKFNHNIQEGFNKPFYSIIVNDTRPILREENDQEYGVPEEKKFPLDSREHVMSAIKFFNYVKPEYEKGLADRVIAKMHKYGISSDHVGEGNRLCKYIDSCSADISEEYELNEGGLSPDMYGKRESDEKKAKVKKAIAGAAAANGSYKEADKLTELEKTDDVAKKTSSTTDKPNYVKGSEVTSNTNSIKDAANKSYKEANKLEVKKSSSSTTDKPNYVKGSEVTSNTSDTKKTTKEITSNTKLEKPNKNKLLNKKFIEKVNEDFDIRLDNIINDYLDN